MQPSRYFKTLLLLIFALSATVVAVNYLIDPYDMFGSKRFKGINYYKSDINNYVRLSKAYASARGKPRVIITGNSRVEMGLDPDHKCLSKQSVYNLGVPGATQRMQFAYVLNLIHAHEVDLVLVSLDYTDFLIPRSVYTRSSKKFIPKGYEDMQYNEDGSERADYFKDKISAYYKSLFTLSALQSSIRTVTGQEELSTDRTQQGFNPANDFLYAVKLEGAKALFKQKSIELQKKYADIYYQEYRDGSETIPMQSLRYFASQLNQKNIKMIFFTNPFHVRYWELLGENGTPSRYQQWVGRVKATLKPYTNAEFWDFSADSPYTDEAIPKDSSIRVPLMWFWEPSHYRKELGDLMLNTMLQAQCHEATELFNGARKLLPESGERSVKEVYE